MVAKKSSTYIALTALLAFLIAYTFSMRYRRIETTLLPSFAPIPSSISGYESFDEQVDKATLTTLRADAVLFRTYLSPGKPEIWLFIGFFASPQENSQIHSPRHCYPGAGWTILSERKISITAEDDSHEATLLKIENGQEKHLVLYWFESADGAIPNEFALKWNQMKNSLLGRNRSTAFVRFSMKLEPEENEQAAAESLARFAASLLKSIEISMALQKG